MIKGYQHQSDFARKYYWQSHDEGQQQARDETLAEHRRELVEKAVRAILDRFRGEARRAP
jgi:hypothetical protein